MAPAQLGKWLVLFCDEINLPDLDKYGEREEEGGRGRGEMRQEKGRGGEREGEKDWEEERKGRGER